MLEDLNPYHLPSASTFLLSFLPSPSLIFLPFPPQHDSENKVLGVREENKVKPVST